MSSDSTKFDQNDQFYWSFLMPKYWGIWFGLACSMVVVILPYPAIVRMGRWLGRLIYCRTPRRVHISRVNLEKCFPELDYDQREQLLRQNFESIGIGVLEAAMAWWWPVRRLEKIVDFHGVERLQGDQGVILLVMHFSTIELAGRLITLHQSIDATYREHKNPVFEYMQRHRRRSYDPGGQLFRRLEVRQILRSLRDGRVVWYSPDQDYGIQQGVFASFFGIPTATVTGTSRMARIGRAKVVPMTVCRRPEGLGYEVSVHEPWEDFPCGDDFADAERLNNFVERQVRKYPQDYMWLHRRFKNRPEGEADFY